MKTENYTKLEKSIYLDLPHLTKIEVGQRFLSKYYGVVVATNVELHSKDIHTIYGFDIESGSPRSEYYPLNLELIGKNIMLNDVLFWLTLNNRTKNHKFEMYNGKASFLIYDKDVILYWDLSKSLLSEQSEELVNWFSELV